MKPEEIESGKTYLMESGRILYVIGFPWGYNGEHVEYQQRLKSGKYGVSRRCLLKTFARKALREVEVTAQ